MGLTPLSAGPMCLESDPSVDLGRRLVPLVNDHPPLVATLRWPNQGVRSLKYNGRVQGVPSLEQNPTTKAYPLIYDLSRPLDELEGQLLHAFAELAHYAVSRTDLASSRASRMRSEHH